MKLLKARMRIPILIRWALVLTMTLVVAGCGGLDGDDEEPTATAEVNEAEPTATLPPFSSPAATPENGQ